MNSEPNLQLDDSRERAVLLVEDNDADVLLLRRAFRDARVANPLFAVCDGQAAIEYLDGKGVYADRTRYPIPFLILLDLRLPKLSGFGVLEWIRDRSHLDLVIAVVLTTSDCVPDVNKAHELGANSYLVKPGSFGELVALVKQIEGRWLMLGNPVEDSAPTETSQST